MQRDMEGVDSQGERRGMAEKEGEDVASWVRSRPLQSIWSWTLQVSNSLHICKILNVFNKWDCWDLRNWVFLFVLIEMFKNHTFSVVLWALAFIHQD